MPSRSPLRHAKSLAKIGFVRDLFTMQTGTAVYMAATLLSSVVYARVLGVDEYGLYAVVLAFVGTVSTFINWGQGSSLSVFFAEEYGKKNTDGMSAVLLNFVHISIFNALLLFACAILGPILSMLLYDRLDIGLFARALFVYQAIDIFNSMILIILQSVRRIRQKVILEQTANIGFLAVSVIAVIAGYGIWGIVVSRLIVTLVFLPVSLWMLRKTARELKLPGLRRVLHTPARKTVPYFTQGILFSLDKNIGGLFPQGLFFALSLVASPAIVGIARIAVQLSNLPKTLLLPQVVGLSTTVLANMRSQGVQVLRTNAAKIIKHTVALHSAISFAALIALPFLIPLFYGAEYIEAIPLTLWLILLSLPGSLTVVNSPLLRLFRNIHYSLTVALFNWVIMLTVLFVSVQWFSADAAFLAAYGIGQLTPLILTAYVFGVLLKPHRRSS